MPKKNVDPQAVYDAADIQQIMAVARNMGPLPFALTAWCYEFGARTAEPGMQLLRDVDMKAARARPLHLKGGNAQAWHFLLPFCVEALPPWLAVRPHRYIKTPEQALYLFPSKAPGTCYTCHGTGQRAKQMREGKRRFVGDLVPCHHCNETGKRWGMDRREVYNIIAPILRAAGMRPGSQHPHTLRHTIITHMLDAGVPSAEIQSRVGHKQLETTLSYARATESAKAETVGKMWKVYGR